MTIDLADSTESQPGRRVVDPMNRRIFLIEPLGTHDLTPSLFTKGNSLEPYAIECLAGTLEAHNYDVAVLQQGPLTTAELIERVAEFAPFCVGISVLTHVANHSKRIAEELRSVIPDVILIAGGQHPSLVPEYIAGTEFDYSVGGEGEVALLELLDYVRAALPSAVLPRGVYIRNGKTSSVIGTPPCPRIRDLDRYPLPKRTPAYLKTARSWNLSYPQPPAQVAVAQIHYSRGCRYRCTFCVSPPVWNGGHVEPSSPSVVYRDARAVAQEVRHLHETYGVNLLYFTDLTFNDDSRRVLDLCEAFDALGLHGSSEQSSDHLETSVHWFALLKVTLESDVAAAMAKAGCSKVGIGVESFDAAQVHSYKKPYKGLETAARTLEAADAAGIITRCLLVLGADGDTVHTVARTREGLKYFCADQLRIAFLVPYPGTPIYEQLNGCRLNQNWDLFDEEHVVLRANGMTKEELYQARTDIALNFYASSQYSLRCRNKIARFPWLTGPYRWFFTDLFEKTKHRIDLRNLLD